MMNTIRHQGIVENINGNHLRVRIVQASGCDACGIKGHCTTVGPKEKLIDVVVPNEVSYRQGDRVWVMGTLSMGGKAVALAFILPFLLVVAALFAGMALFGDELEAALFSFSLLLFYYMVLWRNKNRLSRQFSFYVRAMDSSG